MKKPGVKSSWRHLFRAALAVAVLMAAGCNYPGLSVGPSAPLPAEALRQTMVAGRTTPSLEPAPVGATATLAWPTTAATEYTAPPALPSATSLPVPPEGTIAYALQPGDTLSGLAGRFEVSPEQVLLPPGAPSQGYLQAGALAYIPFTLSTTTPLEALLPDSELVYSPTSAGFDLAGYVQNAGGALSAYSETVGDQTLSGAAVVQRAASELSVNPRLLLALIEFRSRWVLGQPGGAGDPQHPIGFYVPGRSGLNEEIRIAATQLNQAYYGWRLGSFKLIEYRLGKKERLHPALNAGSAAIQHLFALLYQEADWQAAAQEFLAVYRQMFGDPWEQAARAGPLLPADLAQPALELPFRPGERWSLTAGPHPSWNTGTPRGALDLSPVTGEAICAVSRAWVTASAAGVIARAGDNAVLLDLDGDGLEQTGWVVFYFHIAEEEMIAAGTPVAVDTPLGHPSCQGGRATGKHVHVARKYNGEWMLADGPVPFVLGGWQAHADPRNYYGTMTRGDLVVGSNVNGARTSVIVR